MKKFIIAILCSTVVVGFFAYEAYSIITNERDRQTEIMVQARDEINYGLDMTKRRDRFLGAPLWFLQVFLV